MIPLGVLASRRADVEDGVLFSDDFSVAASLIDHPDYLVKMSLEGFNPGSISEGSLKTPTSFDGSTGVMKRDIMVSDVDIRVRCIFNTNIRRHWMLCARVDPSWTQEHMLPSSGYVLSIRNDATPVIALVRNGGYVAFATDFVIPSNDTMGHMRLRVSDDVVQGKYWLDGDTEPESWGIEYTDPSPLSTGLFGISGRHSGNRVIYFYEPFTVEVPGD